MKTILEALACCVLLAGIAVAQQSVGGGGSGRNNRGPDVPSLGLPIRVSGEVLQVDLERKAIQIRSKERKQPVGYAIDAKCKIKAAKKEFDKKELELEEVQPGYRVELTVRRVDLHVIEMKVRKPAGETSS